MELLDESQRAPPLNGEEGSQSAPFGTVSYEFEVNPKDKKGKEKKPKRPTRTHVILLMEDSKRWRTRKGFGGGSNVWGGKATIDAIFADKKIPGQNVTPGGGDGTIRGPNASGTIRVWACYAGKKEWQDSDKRPKSPAPALADRYKKIVKAYDCEIPGKIDERPPGTRPPKPVRVPPAKPDNPPKK